MNPRRRYTLALLSILFPLSGCTSPEDGRPRGGGPGADGGNYRRGDVHVPSKIDGTKKWTARPKV